MDGFGNGVLPANDQVHKLEGHSGGVNSVAWSPSGEKLAPASDDKTVTICNATSEIQVTS